MGSSQNYHRKITHGSFMQTYVDIYLLVIKRIGAILDTVLLVTSNYTLTIHSKHISHASYFY